VNYLNARPLVYGMQKGLMAGEVELFNDYPSQVAARLLNDDIDLGLVPVAIIPELNEHHLVSDYCIACDGPVASVCLFSEVPLGSIQTVLLDYQSRTSVALLKVLLKEHWKISPVLVNATAGYEHQITGNTAGLVIGDRAFEQRLRSTYIYDLGQAWKEMTGLPFVFAAWVSNKPLPEPFTTMFNAANAYGLSRLEEVIKENPCAVFDLQEYYHTFIKYRMEHAGRRALALFLNQLKTVS
jgi:chorismate dehydratase